MERADECRSTAVIAVLRSTMAYRVRRVIVEDLNALVDQRVQRRHTFGTQACIERELRLLPRTLAFGAFGAPLVRTLHESATRILAGAEL